MNGKPTMITNAIEKIDPAKLKIIRTEKSIALRNLALSCGVAPQVAIDWETGKRVVAKKHWRQIVSRLDCQIEELGEPPLRMQIDELKRDLDLQKHATKQREMTIERLQTNLKSKDESIKRAEREARNLQFAPPWTDANPNATITNTVERCVRICQDGSGDYHIIVTNDGGAHDHYNNQQIVITYDELRQLHNACTPGVHNA